MELQNALNVQVANWSVLYTKLHHYHWFVKGPAFFTLHEKFEELYNEAAEVVDVAAERLLAIGGTPVSTLKEYVQTATINEVEGQPSANEMIASLVSDYKQMKEELTSLVSLAEGKDDHVTADFAIGLIEKIDLHVWMFSAYLAD